MLSSFSCIQLFMTIWTIACQAPLSMEFSRQEYWSGLPFSPPGDLSNSGIEPVSHVSYTGRQVPTSATWEAPCIHMHMLLLLLSHLSRVRLCVIP